MKAMTKSLAAALVLSLFATACFDGSGNDSGSAPEGGSELAFVDESEQETTAADPDTSTPDDDMPDDVTANDVDPVDGEPAEPVVSDAADERPCNGGAFPEDDEFRQLVCAVQWAQVDLLAAGAELDSAWVSGGTDAIMMYGSDRDAAVAALEALLVEMNAAMPEVEPVVAEPATAADVSEISAATAGAQACMVEVGELIVTATISGDFDPTEVDGWATDAATAAALAEAGSLTEAEALVCTIRDEIVAAVEAMG